MKTSPFFKSAAVLLTALALGVFLFVRVAVEAHAPSIKDGRFERIGHFGPETATRTIDARGQIVAPGFIDVHTHVESIYSQPAAMIYHGMGEDDVKRIMQEPFTMIASDSGVRQVDESVPPFVVHRFHSLYRNLWTLRNLWTGPTELTG